MDVKTLLEAAVEAEEAGDLYQAYILYKQTIEIDPHQSCAYAAAGLILAKLKQLGQGLLLVQNGLAHNQGDADLYCTLAFLLKQSGDTVNQMKAYCDAIAMRPNDSKPYLELSNLLLARGELQNAYDITVKLIKLEPDWGEAYRNLGYLQERRLEIELAVKSYVKAIELNKNDVKARYYLSLLQLASGNYADGWGNYEYRVYLPELGVKQFKQDFWQGEDITNKTLLVHAEQSLSHNVQFIRYLPLLKGRAGRVILQLPRELMPLFNEITGVDQIIAVGEPLPYFDVYCPLLCLPNRFHVVVNHNTPPFPSLALDSRLIQKWKETLGDLLGDGLHVGIVWMNNQQNPLSKPLSLTDFDVFEGIRGVELISLHLDFKAQQTERETWQNIDIQNFFTGDETLADQVALIETLDLVIGVDSLAVHLSAFMGKKVWLLTDLTPNWLWFADEGASVFYRNVKIYKQRNQNDWSEVMGRVAADLLGFQ